MSLYANNNKVAPIIRVDFPSISTAAEMDALKTSANIGRMYRYTGTSTATYVNGRFYKVERCVNVEFVEPTSGGTPYTYITDQFLTIDGEDMSNYMTPWKSSNQGINNSQSVMKVTVEGLQSITVWINSYAEGNCDYSMLSQLDAVNPPVSYNDAVCHTMSFERDPSTSINNWITHQYTLNGYKHHFWVNYRKDGTARLYTDTGYFMLSKAQGEALFYREYLAPEGEQSITSNGLYNIADKQGINVNVPGIVPTGTLSITENGGYDVTQYAGVNVDVSGGGGGSGYRLYYKYIGGGSSDAGKMKINDEPEFSLLQYERIFPTSNTNNVNYNQPANGVTKFKLWNFYYRGSYPASSSSWARYKLHADTEWTTINLTQDEASATEITLTGDTDLQVFQGSCLDDKTFITMFDGTKKMLREIQVGDVVLGYGGTSQTVTRDEYGWKAYGDFKDTWIFEDGYEIITTFQHRFYNMEHQRMMYLDEWQIGEHAYTEEGKQVALLEHIHEDEPVKYASLWTTDNNYFAGGLLSGNRFTEEILIDITEEQENE